MLKRYHADTPRASFEILPAIDLLGGQVVRLRQGDFDRVTTFSADPVSTALELVGQGSRWLHIVDLDGARAGRPLQTETIRAIVEAVGQEVACQVAGGLRDEGSVDAAMAAGASRVVLGTAALTDPAFAGRMIEAHGSEAIVVAIDVRAGMAVGGAWGPGGAGRRPEEAIDELTDAGVERFAVTAIDRDGLLSGPDLELLGRMVDRARGEVLASGGISTIDDVIAVRAVGCSGAIVGRAIYEGRLALSEALAAVAAEPA